MNIREEDCWYYGFGAFVVGLIVAIPAGIFLAIWYDNPYWLILTIVGLIFGFA